MALHRDIYWVGRQWAVTGHGIQACNQKLRGKFDIEAGRLWQDGVLDGLRAESWLNADDFDKAIAVARKHYPPPEPALARPASVQAGLPEVPVTVFSRREPLAEVAKPAAQPYAMRIDGWPAKFVRSWRIRIRR